VSIPIVWGDLVEADLNLTIRFAYPPDEMEQATLTELLDAWYLIGANRGFGPGFFHTGGSVIFEDDAALWHVDLGSASETAIEVLKGCLEGYAEMHVPIREVILGTLVEK
jgi:hypothetical protein